MKSWSKKEKEDCSDKLMAKQKIIKAWALISEITEDLMVDGYPEGRCWIYPKRKLAEKEAVENEKVVPVKITILK